jgi:hypothetical protein
VLEDIANVADLLAGQLRKTEAEPSLVALASLIYTTVYQRTDAILAEWRRLLDANRPAAAAKPEPTVTKALEQMTDLLRDMTALFAEQQQELRRLHGERKEEPAAA